MKIACMLNAVGVAVLSLSMLSAAGAQQAQQPPASDEQQALETKFAETLSGSTMVGHFTVTGREQQNGLKEEKYTLRQVSKLEGDNWLFQVRIQYGERDLTLPLTLPVKWAGNTPIITVDNLAIPGGGTYTARVLIFGDKYAGTWSGGDHGGHLFGRIEKTPPEDESDETDNDEADGVTDAQ
ncbi:MAG: hypothetical protein WDZ59_08635 [Pirellulales bacterium]